jgi:carbon storage regulator
MLVLSRKPGEKVRIGPDITLTLIEVKGNRVRIGIEAPDQVCVLRGELKDLESITFQKFEEQPSDAPPLFPMPSEARGAIKRMRYLEP